MASHHPAETPLSAQKDDRGRWSRNPRTGSGLVCSRSRTLSSPWRVAAMDGPFCRELGPEKFASWPSRSRSFFVNKKPFPRRKTWFLARFDSWDRKVIIAPLKSKAMPTTPRLKFLLPSHPLPPSSVRGKLDEVRQEGNQPALVAKVRRSGREIPRRERRRRGRWWLPGEIACC